MGQWLSAIGGYSVEQVGQSAARDDPRSVGQHCADYYPSGMTAFAIVSTLVCATWTDHTHARWPVLVYMSFCCTAAAICILVWSSPTGLKFFAYCVSRGVSFLDRFTDSAVGRYCGCCVFRTSDDVCVSKRSQVPSAHRSLYAVGPTRYAPTTTKNARSFWHP